MSAGGEERKMWLFAQCFCVVLVSSAEVGCEVIANLGGDECCHACCKGRRGARGQLEPGGNMMEQADARGQGGSDNTSWDTAKARSGKEPWDS